MSDYEMLNALLDEYKAELKKRKDGETIKYMDCGLERKHKFRPNNKARLSRLRLEISRLMLQVERKMGGSVRIEDKEGWE